MPGQRFDVLVSRESKDGKRFYTKVGSAWSRDDGGMSVKLDALPLDGDLLIKPPLERDRGPREQGQFRQNGNNQRYRHQSQPQRMKQQEMYGGRQPPPEYTPPAGGSFADDSGEDEPF